MFSLFRDSICFIFYRCFYDNMIFSKREIHDLLLTWLLVGLAFTIFMYRGELTSFTKISNLFIFSFITIGLGVIIHELSHKFTARHYHIDSIFIADRKMLFLSLLFSFGGFLFLAPGGVYMKGNISQKKIGIISLAGPFSNITIAVIFLLLLPISSVIAPLGLKINAFLGLFNLIPFGPFDGKKVFAWNKVIYASTTILAIVLLVMSYII